MRLIPFVIAMGLALSCYAYYVEFKVREAERIGLEYHAYCNIGMFSCTKVFSSKYGSATQLVGLPAISNAALGAFFYMLELLLEPVHAGIFFALASCGLVASIGLFTILTLVMNDFCIVCFSVYAVNIITFIVAYRRYTAQGRRAVREQKMTSKKDQ